jgi:hypothetical protein
MQLDSNILVSSIVLASLIILGLLSTNNTFAAETFEIEANIDLSKIPNTEKLKVIAFANGEFDVKFIDNIQEMKSKSISVSFTFERTNDLVTVGVNDEYFVCAYDIKPKTDIMKSYSCVEGNIENTDGKNTINIGSGSKNTLSTGSFQSVDEVGKSKTKEVIINILVPLSDRKNVQNIKVTAMNKGDLLTKEVNAADLLKNSNGDTIKFSFNFDRKTEIGQIEKGDLYFACVSADELNPPEGTECEHKLTKTIGRGNNLYAR